eukprot:4346642-Prymnesium_polylepis.1
MTRSPSGSSSTRPTSTSKVPSWMNTVSLSTLTKTASRWPCTSLFHTSESLRNEVGLWLTG